VRTRIEPVDEPEVSATAYRLVREAVTNALRHSDGRRIIVDVWHASHDLKVLVQDDGAAADAAEEHAGLTGLRERVAALGGHLDAGPAAHGWHVSATLPLPAGRPPAEALPPPAGGSQGSGCAPPHGELSTDATLGDALPLGGTRD
jgi:glucose-6-phosphate-specific signal transduction histidine kinase